MKKILFLVLFPCMALSQSYRNDIFYPEEINGTAILNQAYASAQLDTTQAIKCSEFAGHFVSVQSKDSASIHIKYQLSVDGVTWSLLATQDSLSTASNTGDIKTLNMTSVVNGSNFVRYVFNQTAFRVGTSTATYTALITNKRY
jgi:hypothetical protein